MGEESKVIATAKAEVGYLEKKSMANLDSKTENAGSGNYTKYWKDMLTSMQGQPWCQCFVNWCFKKTFGEAKAKELLYCSGKGWTYYTPTAAGYFKTAKRWHTSGPQAGDVIYFKNSARIHHVGIVIKVSGGTVYTIEGNTSGGSAVIANGGGVCQKSYQIGNSSIAGYGRPNYNTENQTQSTATTTTTLAAKKAAAAKSYDKSIAGTYTTKANLNVRQNAGTSAAVLGVLQKGTRVKCYGYYTACNGVKWYLVQGESLTGYCSSAYLQK